MARDRIVIVGLGSIGRRHARLLAARGDVTVELCDPSEGMIEQAKKEAGDLKVHSDYRKALESKPGYVLIATPQTLHADQSIAALVSGAHVLCEKPIADTVENAQRMLDAASGSDKVLSIAYMMHFHPIQQRVREMIRSGELGQILHVHYRVGSYITLVNSQSRYQRTLAGALLMDYAHQPDLLYWWLGEVPKGVYVAGVESGKFEFSSNPNALSVTLDYASPMIATLNLNYAQMPQRHEFEIVGDKAWVLVDIDERTIRIGRREGQTVERETFTVERDEMYVKEHDAFFAASAGKRAVESPADEAIVSMKIVENAIRSWREGKRVEWKD